MDELTPAVRRYRTSLKFSLWTWALYWAGGGMLIISTMRNPVGIAIMLGSLSAFIMLLAFGGLSIRDSETWREFLLERPIYALAGFVVLVFMAPLLTGLQNIGIAVLASAFTASLVLQLVRAVHVTKERGGNAITGKTDQVIIALALAILMSLFNVIDGFAQIGDATGVGNGAESGLIINWVNLLYPAIIMLASRGLREPLRRPSMRVPEPTQDVPIGPGVKLVKVSKDE